MRFFRMEGYLAQSDTSDLCYCSSGFLRCCFFMAKWVDRTSAELKQGFIAKFQKSL